MPSERKDKDSDAASGDGKDTVKGTNSDKEPSVANGNGDQSVTQIQDPSVPPKPTSSAADPPPDWQGASDHPGTVRDKNSEDSAIVDDQMQSLEADRSEVTSDESAAKLLPHLHDTSFHPLDSGGDNNQNAGADKGSRKRTADEDVGDSSSAKLPRHESKEGDARKETTDSVKPDAGKGSVEKPLKDEPPKQPDKPPIQQAGDSQTHGETYATVTRQKQVSVHILHTLGVSILGKGPHSSNV